MDVFRLDAYISEFPFLVELLPESEVDSIQVKRWDSAVLKLVPQEFEFTGSLVDISRRDRWYARTDEGLVEFGQAAYDFRSNYAYAEPESRPGYTLLDSLSKKFDEKHLPDLLVNIAHTYDATRGRRTQDSTCITIYKPARGVELIWLLKQARAEAAAQVAAECDF